MIFSKKLGFIVKVKHPDNHKTNHYFLTEKGLSLTAVIIELALWSHENINPIDDQRMSAFIDIKDKNKLQQVIIERYKSKTVTLRSHNRFDV
jgi:DNA-binding MarR family transcriptional regulator